MVRFSSLKFPNTETRRILRDRFTRYLPSQEISVGLRNKDVLLDDELFLTLFLNLTIDIRGDIKKARATYNAQRRFNPTEPRLNELIKAGLIRVVWGRISIPSEVAERVRSDPTKPMTALNALLEKRFEKGYRITSAARSDAVLVDLVSKIKNGKLQPHDIGCLAPEWVAARLWDRTLSDSASVSTSLRVWVDRWIELDCPSILPGRAWDQTAANAFFDAAFDVLESDQGLFDWEGIRANIGKQISFKNGCGQSTADDYVPATPVTLVNRYLWFDDPLIERFATQVLFDYEDIIGLVRPILAEIEAEDHSLAPHKLFERLLRLSIDRPELLFTVLRWTNWSPVLLADILLYPATSALACLLVAQWQSPSSAWDRQLTTRDNQTTQLIAFADATSVMGHFLKQGTLDAAEVASLFAWFHNNARFGFANGSMRRDSMLAILRTELTNQSPAVQKRLANALSAGAINVGVGTTTFFALLDIVDIGNITNDIDPEPLVNGYIQGIVAGEPVLSVQRVGTSGAAVLVKLSMRTSTDLHCRFLQPIDIKEQLAITTANERPRQERILGESIRAHIRVLCRAVTGWQEIIPEDLVQATINAVRVGALRHQEKGRIAAFSPSYEANGRVEPLDRPIAADIGSALGALDQVHAEQLLTAVLETDEPMMLAQLLGSAPHKTRDKIKQRIALLTPSEAGDIYSLTHAQARIEALLSANLGEAAQRFMDDELEFKTWGQGPNPEREMIRMRANLRLNLMRGEWDKISTREPPSDFNKARLESANEVIIFYKALAELKNPLGDRQRAEEMFAELQKKHPGVAAYAQNLFAARITLLLAGDFSQLQGAALGRGRQIMIEAEELMLQSGSLDNRAAESFQCNKALLLLAMGQSEAAAELLASVHVITLHSAVAAYRSVALSRLDRAQEAVAILDEAERVHGVSDLVRSAREHVESGRVFFTNVNILSTDNPIPRTKAALFDLKQMNPEQQANVLMPQAGNFSVFVTDQVRSAAASVTSLVPMMSNMVIDKTEDDVSALIRELLTHSMQFLSWTVSDQSKGGHTAKGNPGERDLILKKDSTTLAVIEAIVCKQNVPAKKLRQHFQKLFAYSECCLFFYLVYAYTEKPDEIEKCLQEIAKTDSPVGFEHTRIDNIARTDSKPIGFTAHYNSGFGDVRVVFLILDMGQYAQKDAAKTSTGYR